MKYLKSHFRYNSRQRNGILFLVIVIIITQILYFLIDFNDNKPLVLTNSKINSLQAKIDSLKSIKNKPKKFVVRPFNPSFLSGYRAYKLGLNTDEIDKLLRFRKRGKYINSAKQFQFVTGVSDSLLATLKPLFKFPDWVIAKQKNKLKNKNSTITIKDINTATAQDLVAIKGVGIKTANRIINYRNFIKGFSFKDQLYEVYYLDTIVADNILKKFKIFEKPKIKKLNINTATFKEILHLPYINYALTKKIMDYRDEVAEIKNLEELKKIEGFPLDKFNRIALYLKAE